MKKLGRDGASRPLQPFLYRGVIAMPLNNTGFGPAAADLIRRFMNTDLVITLCGHPFQALDSTRPENSEHVDQLANLLSVFETERKSGKLKFCTMGEVERDFRASNETAQTALREIGETR
jgi:hypothetical protein